MLKCVRTHKIRVRDLVSTNLERWRVSEADTAEIDPFAIGVNNEDSDDICTFSLTDGFYYNLYVQIYNYLAS